MTSTRDQSNTEDDEAVENGYKKNLRSAMAQIIAVTIKNLLLIVYGMTLGFPTILIPAVENPREGEILHLQKSEISWISSLHLMVIPIGCALSGVVTASLGRKRAMQMINVPYFIAWLLFYYSSTTAHLYGALALAGLAGGLQKAPVLTYVAEITQPHLRGSLCATSTMSTIIGVFTQFLFGMLMYWRTMALVNAAFTSLQWLRGWTKPYAVEEEFKAIQLLVEGVELKETVMEKISNYMGRGFIAPFLLVCYSFFVGHYSGMTTLQTYAVKIFQLLEAPMDEYYATLILGVLQICGAALCVMLVHHTGKRPIALVSTSGAAVCSLLIACYDGYLQRYYLPNIIQSHNTTNADYIGIVDTAAKNPYAWMPLTLLLLLAFVTNAGLRVLPFMLMGEVFNTKTRSGSAGLAGAAGYLLNFSTNKTFLTLVETCNIWGTFTIYSTICFTGVVVFYFFLPETEGKTLIEIENHFAGVKKLTNVVYRPKRRQPTNTSRMHNLKGTTTTNPSFEGDKEKI